MEKHYHDDPAFDYVLSAFISAARSVTWVMKAEHVHLEQWTKWYASKAPSVDEAEFLKKINDLRVRAVKRATPATAVMVELSMPTECVTREVERYLRDSVGRRMDVRLVGFQRDPVDHAGATVTGQGLTLTGAKLSAVYRAVEEFPEEDVLAVARRYYEWLAALLAEGEAHVSGRAPR
jgi:hypothetical protein